jgi:hypothetical protein
MPEEQSRRTQTEEFAHVDHLLGLIGELSRSDPSPALRQRLSAIADERLSGTASPAIHRVTRARSFRLRAAFAAVPLAVIGLTIAFAVHFPKLERTQTTRTTTGTDSGSSLHHKAQVTPAATPSVARQRKVYRSGPAVQPSPGKTESIGAQQMTIRLPYSNSAIATGTGATIAVSMSQSELLSLGFPINTTVRDRRVVAELTLGDDGLPRAISVPLPLEVVKEKK